MRWYVIYTKPRTEHKVTFKLEHLGIQAYCPMITQIRRWSDRNKKILIPAISSHVFVKIREAERKDVFQVSGVIRYLFSEGKPAIIREREIEDMKYALSGALECTSVSHYKTGDQVRIPNGLFKDKDVIVDKVDNKNLYLFLQDTGIQIIIKLV